MLKARKIICTPTPKPKAVRTIAALIGRFAADAKLNCTHGVRQRNRVDNLESSLLFSSFHLERTAKYQSIIVR